MEEVDCIILHFLKQLDLNINEDTKKLCDLSVETIFESASKCLVTINPNLKVPARLPSGISHRIEVAAQIASICKDLGYKNDVGYQTFLYYNEAELRQVFMFLIEHLPSEGQHNLTGASSPPGKTSVLQNISKKIDDELNSIWIPPCCNKNNSACLSDNMNILAEAKYSGINKQDLIKKLMKINPSVKPKNSSHEQILKGDVEPGNRKDIVRSLKELKETAIVLRQKVKALESEINVRDVEYLQAHKSLEKANIEFANVHNILSNVGIEVKGNDIGVDNVLEKVQKHIDTLHLNSEEQTSRNMALKVEIEKLKNSSSLLGSERMKCKNTLNSLKDTAKSIKEEYNKKEILKAQLKMKYDKLKGGNKRSIYTKRILEIIGNVDKQNLEIKKIIEDTRQLQKEINSLEGQLDRCFSIADETLFGDAKKDDQAKKAYKLLALLHSECNTIVSLVNDTGSLAREIVDLEDNIKMETSKRTEDTLQRIQVDLNQMENESLRIQS